MWWKSSCYFLLSKNIRISSEKYRKMLIKILQAIKALNDADNEIYPSDFNEFKTFINSLNIEIFLKLFILPQDSLIIERISSKTFSTISIFMLFKHSNYFQHSAANSLRNIIKKFHYHSSSFHHVSFALNNNNPWASLTLSTLNIYISTFPLQQCQYVYRAEINVTINFQQCI